MDEKNNQKYLISISIGPVQDFISTARRSRDLWFGSWLLSELSKAAAKSIVEQGGELIFPKISGAEKELLEPETEFNVVNKILAEIEENPFVVGKNVKEAIDERLGEIRNKAFRELLRNNYFEQGIAEQQVADLIEFFWVAVKHENPETYKADRNKVEYLFSARKATRNFKPVNLWDSGKENAWGKNVPKTALDGQRESVIHEDIYEAVRRGGMKKEDLRLQFGVREGERLCGVGLLKRRGNRKSRINSTNDDSFFSTSHVASLPLLETLTDKTAVENYIKRLKELGLKDGDFNKVPVPKNAMEHSTFSRYDGHLLFEERLIEYFDLKDEKEKRKLAEAKEALRYFLKVALEDKKPLPYYALLLADGDAMGKAIDAQKNKTSHQNLSAELSAFAKDVRTIVEITHKGSLVYAGGDDVLAFVPLHTVLDCAKDLAILFKEKLKNFEFKINDEKKTPTLSVGIAVAHHLEPLEDALEIARKAEKAAKSVDGKNALAVIVDKRSGTSRTLKGGWGTIDERLNQFVEWHLDKEALNSAAYQLKDLANRLEVSDRVSVEDRSILQRAKLAEAKRILKRKKVSEATLENLNKYLGDISDVLKKEHLAKGEDENKFTDKSVEVLADELIIAKIFADAKRLARPK